MPDLYDNRYRYIKPLGEGGFGKVFLAKEEQSEELVAIKQLNHWHKEKQDAIIHEMQMIAKFNHPNIVIYKHNFSQDGSLYIVMEYCAIGNLRDMLKKQRVVSSFAWKWIGIIAKTLQFVHEKKIVHHDIKPDNILFTADRILKISDFGIANTTGGTIPYMSPEALKWDYSSINDVRVDVYALGVTLLELITGKNPFLGKTRNEILEIHDKKDFGIIHLPNWQQEIILKAIAKIPEQRFQNMKDFDEAIQAKNIPIVFDKEVILAGDIAEQADLLMARKKWSKAYSLLEYAEKQFKPSVNVLRLLGKYYLLQQKLKKAQEYYEKALKWNPRLDVQKDLGWINLEKKNYPTAISLLSDHLHRNPSDYEAYNLLLQCFYETNRYELAMDLAKTILNVDKENLCFANNYYISYVLQNPRQKVCPKDVLKTSKTTNPFLDYNSSVVFEEVPTHDYDMHPQLKSKLLFMDYRFSKFKSSSLFCPKFEFPGEEKGETENAIIKFGRKPYICNDIMVSEKTEISRRHCLIVNCKDEVWLYDLNSTGTFVDDERVVRKIPLVGRKTIRIGDLSYEITNDRSKLF